MTNHERRHYQRIPFIAEIILSYEGEKWTCQLEGISLKGILVDLPDGVEAQYEHLYHVELLLGEEVNIVMNAMIRHVNEHHWGMTWENIELESLTHLRRLLELNMGDQDEIHRELAELG